MSSSEAAFEPVAFEAVVPRRGVSGAAWTPAPLAEVAPPRASYTLVDEEAERAVAMAAQAEAERAAEAEMLALQHRAEVESAHAAGFDAGRAEGERAERARLRHAMQTAERALDDMRAGESAWTGNIEENLAALAVAIARQVIGHVASIDDGVVRAVVRKALAEFPVDQPLVVRVHPADLEALQQAEREGTPAHDAAHDDVRWVGDARVQRGGCLVEGRERIVDGRVDTALERTYRRLTYTHA